MPYIALYTAILVGGLCSVTAVVIDGREMSIDEALYESGRPDIASGVFDLIQDEKTLLVELDMEVDIDTYNEMYMDTNGDQRLRKRRKALRDLDTRWKNQRVPYEITNEFTKEEKGRIGEAIDEYHRYTCLKFVPATESDFDRVRFQSGKHCKSKVGRIGGPQYVMLKPTEYCRSRGVIVHEIGHAIGFKHEQNRHDRGDYVIINNSNIEPGKEQNFKLYSKDYINTYDVPYDYSSVMHYSGYAFAQDRSKKTIITIDKSKQSVIGNRDGLSYSDIELANLMYNCTQVNDCKKKDCSEGFQGPDCKCWCDSGDRMNPIKECDKAGPPVPITTTIHTPAVIPVTTTTTETVTKPPTVEPVTTSTCQDKMDVCPVLAARRFCTGSYRRYVRDMCPHSCNRCHLKEQHQEEQSVVEMPECVDRDRYCDYHAEAGACRNNPYYMLNNCRKACNACGQDYVPECADASAYCDSYLDYCQTDSFLPYLFTMCRKSCGFC